MNLIINIIKIMLLIVVIIFSAINIQSVDLYYFIGKDPIKIPLFLLIILSFLIGFVVSWILSLKRSLRKFMEVQSLKSELKRAKEELTNLKSAPLKREGK
ncbi:MAG: LapA family protein [Calditerrivibrio sp.]|nr:LapA family protein [Calditerrivibrio sp.]